ncbi:hypothetical protein DPMN_032679 [Dreissena polymorpha]|uniref:Uncharacterized protein n=1 Tax=Dreissena polymorpha TaxID=45954 RepID=A0A9D4M2B9_DREPO|nr:hypothetical protein DPMN_032679 [Dreissena polymorpha]
MADNNDQSDSEVDFNVNENGRGEGQEYQEGQFDEAYGGFYRRGPRPNIKPDPYSGDEDWDQYIAYLHNETKRRSYYTLLHLLSSRHACITVRYLLQRNGHTNS